MSMYEQDQWQREGENEKKLRKMKEEAIKNNDIIIFNAINLYEKNGKDVTILIKAIKDMYEQSREKK